MNKEVGGVNDQGEVTERRFYLADANSINRPCIVVPDIGGKPNAHFEVKNVSKWFKEFVNWSQSAHNEDEKSFPMKTRMMNP